MEKGPSDAVLYQTRIENIPKNTLYKVLAPVYIEEDKVLDPGEYLIVPDDKALPLPIRLLVQTLRRTHPETAHFIIHMRNVVVCILIARYLHEGEAIAVGTGETRIKPGPKRTLTPTLITAEKVAPHRNKVRYLPKNKPFFLATNSHCISRDGVTFLSKLPEDYTPDLGDNATLGDESVLEGNIFLEGLFMMKGTALTLMERDGKLFARRGGEGSKDQERIEEFPIDPDCELEVFIPKDTDTQNQLN